MRRHSTPPGASFMADQAAQQTLDEEPTAGGGEATAEQPSRRRLFVIGGASIAVLAAAGVGGAVWLGLLGGDDVAREPPPVFFDLPEMTVNLSSVGNNPQYLRLSAALELRDERVAATIEPVLPRVLDAFQVYLRELRSTDIEGSAGLFRLKEELVRRVNMAIHPAEIEAVVFKEIIVQ